eukprot:11811431-Heterocapsa_arctica.AAC.1
MPTRLGIANDEHPMSSGKCSIVVNMSGVGKGETRLKVALQRLSTSGKLCVEKLAKQSIP